MMLPVIIIGAAFVGLIGVCVEYFYFKDLVSIGAIEAKLDFYFKLFSAYLILLIPPYILSSPSRTETAKNVGAATGLAAFEIAKWIAIGVLISIGFHAVN